MQTFLKEIEFMEWNAAQDKGRAFEEGIHLLSSEHPHRADLIQAYHDRWKESLGNAIEGSVEIVKQLKAKGYPLYGLSNWSTETFPYALKKFEFLKVFDDMVISGYVGYVKPEPAIYELLLQKVGKPARECLFIDDSLANIEQASKMGINTIHFTSAEKLKMELTRLDLL
jgi:2-haloacid dehalogenase